MKEGGREGERDGLMHFFEPLKSASNVEATSTITSFRPPLATLGVVDVEASSAKARARERAPSS